MRNFSNYVALSLLAAAFAGCSSTDTGSTSKSSSYDPGLTGALAKYNESIVPLAAGDCIWTANTGSTTKGTIAVALKAKEIGILSLRSVDSAVLLNGSLCSNTTAGVTTPIITSSMVTGVAVTGPVTASDETIIFDIRNGIIVKGATTAAMSVALGAASATDEIAILGTAKTDAMKCTYDGTANDTIDLDGDGKADITVTPATAAANHFTVDLSDGDDTFNQNTCKTKMSVYGGIGADTITIGTALTKGDIFSGGTETGTTAKADTITYAARVAGVSVSLDGTANDGDTATSENDNVLDDFEVITGTAYNDVLASGNTQVSYTLNGAAGNDTLSSMEDHEAIFNGGDGTDTVDYHLRTSGVTVTMDGAKIDDGEKSATPATTATFDNVGKDVENLIATDSADTITGNALSNIITPGGGDDIVLGGDGDDTMVAGLVNGSPNDAVDGNDHFAGGNGVDTVDYSSRILAGPVTAALDAVLSTDAKTATNTPTNSGNGSTEADFLGVDVENLVGTVGADTLTGNASVNSIWGMGGGDTIYGMAGNDVVDANGYLAMTPAGKWCGLASDGTAGGKCTTVAGGTTLLGSQSGCDCTVAAVNQVNSICNPSNLAAVGAGTTACNATSMVATCGQTTVNVNCGGDPLDIVSCAGVTGSTTTSGTIKTATSGATVPLDVAAVWTTANTQCWKIQP